MSSKADVLIEYEGVIYKQVTVEDSLIWRINNPMQESLQKATVVTPCRYNRSAGGFEYKDGFGWLMDLLPGHPSYFYFIPCSV